MYDVHAHLFLRVPYRPLGPATIRVKCIIPELSLRSECLTLGIPYIPYQLEYALRGGRKYTGFADVVHGGVIIEYEPPRSFSAGRAKANVQHAKEQVEDYVLVIWDGTNIAFGTTDGVTPTWESLVAFNVRQGVRLLTLLRTQGCPLVHPGLLRTMVGPESEIGSALIPALFSAVVAATTDDSAGQTKTTLLFKEWNRLFGQTVGIPTDRLKDFLDRQSHAHQQPYETHIPCYLFALHTFIATVAKLVDQHP